MLFCQEPSSGLWHHVPEKFLKLEEPFSWLKNPFCNILNLLVQKGNHNLFLLGFFLKLKTKVKKTILAIQEHGSYSFKNSLEHDAIVGSWFLLK